MCPTEPLTTMSMPRAEMPQRLEALPSITQQAAAAGGAGGRRGVAFDVHAARHHVLGDADAGRAVDDDIGALVHAGAVIADIAVDLDGDGCIDAGGDGMAAARIEHAEIGVVGPLREIVQHLIELAK